LSQTKVLLHFDVLDPGGDPNNTGIRVSGRNDAPGQNWFNAPNCYQDVNPGLGYEQRFGYSPIFGGFYSVANGLNSYMEAAIPGIDGAAGALTVEALANIDQACWDALTNTAGPLNRYSPVVSLIAPGGELVWTLGFFSRATSGFRSARVVMTAFIQRLESGDLQLMRGRDLTTRPGRYIHIAAQRSIDFGMVTTAGWTEGFPSTDALVWGGAYTKAATATCRIGNTCPGVGVVVFGGAGADSVPFLGGIDEVRVTAVSRYTSYINSTLPPAARVIPWPNY